MKPTPQQQHRMHVEHLAVDHGYDDLAGHARMKLSRLREVHLECHEGDLTQVDPMIDADGEPVDGRTHFHPTGHISPLELKEEDGEAAQA